MITPMTDISAEIREMTHVDLAEVADIERRSYEFPWSHGVFRDCLLAGYHCIVIVRSEQVVGYSILSVAAGEAHILNLCVDRQHRKLGYGQKLLRSLLDFALEAEVREVLLEVRPSNDGAITLYENNGFRKIADRPDYYQARDGREDAAVYSRKLKPRRD